MKRIAKKTREQAALICAIAACEVPEGISYRGPRAWYAETIGPGLGASQPAIRLAIAAWEHVTKRNSWCQWHDAEAEALLRCGWEPS